MNFEAHSGAALSLGDDVGLRKISEAQELLMGAIQANSSIVIEFSDNHHADISTVQLLESARIFASTCGKSIKLAQPAHGSLLSALERGGFLTNIKPEDSSFWMHNGD